MRIILACVVLMLAPTLGLIAIRGFQEYQAQQRESLRLDKGQSHRAEVLFFNASWCGPCRSMKPIVSQMRSQGYHMRDIDVDKNQALAAKYGIRAVPTFVFIENGTEVNRFSGGRSPDELRKMCASAVYR